MSWQSFLFFNLSSFKPYQRLQHKNYTSHLRKVGIRIIFQSSSRTTLPWAAESAISSLSFQGRMVLGRPELLASPARLRLVSHWTTVCFSNLLAASQLSVVKKERRNALPSSTKFESSFMYMNSESVSSSHQVWLASKRKIVNSPWRYFLKSPFGMYS